MALYFSGRNPRFTPNKFNDSIKAYCFNRITQRIYFSNENLFDLNRTLIERVHVDFINSIDDRYITFGTFGLTIFDIDRNEKRLFLPRTRSHDAIHFNNFIYVYSLKGLYRIPINGTLNSEKLILPDLLIDDLEPFGECMVLGTNGVDSIF